MPCVCYGVYVVLFILLYVLSMPMRLEDAPCAISMTPGPVEVATCPVGALPSTFPPLSLDRVLPQRLSFDVFFPFSEGNRCRTFLSGGSREGGKGGMGSMLAPVCPLYCRSFVWSGRRGRGDGSGRRSSRSARCDAQRLCSLLFHIWCEIQQLACQCCLDVRLPPHRPCPSHTRVFCSPPLHVDETHFSKTLPLTCSDGRHTRYIPLAS